MIYNYFTSPGFYLSREIHWQHKKQNATEKLKKAELNIVKWREKRNAIQYNGLDYLGKSQEEKTSEINLNEFIDMNIDQGD
jgi:hypothetical protein